MNATFHALADEATFTRDILGAGVTQIGKANYAKKGMYFQAFTSLSTGLERIGKMCLILDYYIRSSGQFPNDEYNTYIRNQIGHDLKKLHSKSIEIISHHNFNLSFLKNLDEPIHKEIIEILSSFAKGERYSNINFLIKGKRESDPMYDWYTKIDMTLFSKRVSKKKKETIKFNAQVIDIIGSSFMRVKHTSESREELNTIERSSYQTGVYQAVFKYRQLYVLHIIRYWVELLNQLGNLAMNVNFEKEEIPYFSEIFALFFNDDSYFLTRRTFDENH